MIDLLEAINSVSEPLFAVSNIAFTIGLTHWARKKARDRKRKNKTNLETILSMSGYGRLNQEILEETGRELSETQLEKQPEVVIYDTTNAMNSQGYVVKTDVRLKSGEKIGLITKYVPEPEKGIFRRFARLTSGQKMPPTAQQHIITGGAVQQYLHTFVGLDAVPASFVASAEMGNISYVIEDAKSLVEVEKGMNETTRENTARALVKQALDIATAPIFDGYCVEHVLPRYKTKGEQITRLTQDQEFIAAYQKEIAGFLDPRAGFLSHNDLYAQNILVTREGTKIIDFDNSCLQSYQYDINSIIKTLGIRTKKRQAMKDRIESYVRQELEERLKVVDPKKVTIQVQTNTSEQTIGIGKPYAKEEFEQTMHAVEFDNDLAHGIVLERKLERDQKKFTPEDRSMLETLKAYYFTRAKETIDAESAFKETKAAYTKLLQAKNQRLLAPAEMEELEESCNPDQNTWRFIHKYKSAPSQKHMQTRVEEHTDRLLDGTYRVNHDIGEILNTVSYGIATGVLTTGCAVAVYLGHPIKEVLQQTWEYAGKQLTFATVGLAMLYAMGRVNTRLDERRNAPDPDFHKKRKSQKQNYRAIKEVLAKSIAAN